MICFMEIVTHTRERILSREQRCVWVLYDATLDSIVLYQIRIIPIIFREPISHLPAR